MRVLYKFGSEYDILLHKDLTEIEKFDSKLTEGIDRMRRGKVFVEPGFDGEYGKIKVFGEPTQTELKGQTILF